MVQRLIFVKTHRTQYLVVPVHDDLRNRMDILFGYCYRMLVERDWMFDKKHSKWKKVNAYSRYITDVPVQVCTREDIVELRKANDIEHQLYDVCRRKLKVWPKIKWDKYNDGLHMYLRHNFMIDNTLNGYPTNDGE